MRAKKINNLDRKDNTQFVLFVISVVIFILQAIVNENTINFPNWIVYILALLALIFCCLTEKQLFIKIKQFPIGYFLLQYFVLFLLFLGGGMFVFGKINNLISKDNIVERNFYEISRVSQNTSVTPNFIETIIEGKEVTIQYKSS